MTVGVSNFYYHDQTYYNTNTTGPPRSSHGYDIAGYDQLQLSYLPAEGNSSISWYDQHQISQLRETRQITIKYVIIISNNVLLFQIIAPLQCAPNLSPNVRIPSSEAPTQAITLPRTISSAFWPLMPLYPRPWWVAL